MHYSVDQGLQKVGSFVYDNFLSEEIDFFLNKMQERFIKDRMFNRSDEKRLGFSGNQKRLDDLRGIIEVDAEELADQSGTPVYVEYDIPTNYLYLLNVRAIVTPVTCLTEDRVVAARVISHDIVYEMLKNPFSKSTLQSPIVTMDTDYFNVFTDESYLIKGVRFDYVRKPAKISLSSSQDSELAEHTHHEIVDLTVKHILEIIESPRYQSNRVETSEKE